MNQWNSTMLYLQHRLELRLPTFIQGCYLSMLPSQVVLVNLLERPLTRVIIYQVLCVQSVNVLDTVVPSAPEMYSCFDQLDIKGLFIQIAFLAAILLLSRIASFSDICGCLHFLSSSLNVELQCEVKNKRKSFDSLSGAEPSSTFFVIGCSSTELTTNQPHHLLILKM